MQNDLRTRLYESYVSGRQTIAPASIADLAPRAPYLRRLILDHFPKDREASVLELGCGYGALLHFAREAGYTRLRGVDVSPEQASTAAQLGISGVEQGDLITYLGALEPDSQDCIVAFDVLEHFAKSEITGLVDAVRRALNPRGRWIVHVPNAESPFFGAIRYGDLTHELAFTQTSLPQLLLASGYSRVHCYEDLPVVHGAKSAVRSLIWRGIRLALRAYVAAETGEAGGAIFTRNLLAVAFK